MTATAFLPPPSASTPASVVAGARDLVGQLHDVLWAARTPQEKLDAVSEVEKLKSGLAAIEAEVVTEIDATKAAAEDGWGSAADFVTAISGGYHGSGASAVRLAKALTGDRRATLDALRHAAISQSQARVIVAAIDNLPSMPELRDQAEAALLEQAKTLNASELKVLGKRLVEMLDPEGDERRAERDLAREERAAHLRRFLSISEDGAGGVRIKGRSTVEDAALIKQALFALAAPVTGDPGACGGDPSTPSGACGQPGCAHDGRDPRDHGARFLDALVEGCRRLMGTEMLPADHGATPRLSLTMSYHDLLSLTGTATLETGERLSASAVRRLSCDANLTPIVLGGESEILDVGRTRRLVTAAIWKALVARDRHCVFPGCRRPPAACDAHHIVHWLDGGGTGLDNLALLCRTHHTMIHTTPWQIRLNPVDKRPEFIPPVRLDPEQRPVRHRRPRE